MRDKSHREIAADERRVSVRYACEEEAICHLGAARSYECRWARLRDVSATGAGLLLPACLRPGTRVSLEFTDASKRARRVLRARVAHCTGRNDGSWLVGCHFEVPLGEDDLQSLAGDGQVNVDLR